MEFKTVVCSLYKNPSWKLNSSPVKKTTVRSPQQHNILVVILYLHGGHNGVVGKGLVACISFLTTIGVILVYPCCQVAGQMAGNVINQQKESFKTMPVEWKTFRLWNAINMVSYFGRDR